MKSYAGQRFTANFLRGKEGYGSNTKTTLDALCFIERSEENFIEKQG